jgi:hypothetical protein
VTYELNPNSIGPPTRYLGADVDRVTCPRDPSANEYWSFSAHTYVQNAVKNVKLILKEEGRGLKSTAKTSFPSTTYRPKMDMTDECNDNEASRFSQRGVLRWAIELGRIDIYTEVSLMSQQLALPQIRHLTVIYHIFAYLKKHDSRITFDSTDPIPVTPTVVQLDWSSFYQDAHEELPPRIPEPLGLSVNICTLWTQIKLRIW